ncbi:MAG: hypothetical protein C0605_01085 [Hyphomicrobiales bacterium]|nr:MAG: hypothetical protein C0605_01085 [Hyphomicrobiales bacterium]
MAPTSHPRLCNQGGPVPASAGIGLKAMHCDEILSSRPRIGWFEFHAENYMGAGGLPHRQLTAIAAHYPLSMHGVGLSLGGEAPPDKAHLQRLRALAERYRPGLVSEHLAWCGRGGHYFNDLLPTPYTPRTLERLCAHVDLVQTALGRQILIENPAVYLRFEESCLTETEFLEKLTRATGCGLLLDVNNVHVSAVNLGFEPLAYLEAFPVHAVAEIHLAGHLDESSAAGAPLLIDDHGSPVAEPVWQLFAAALRLCGPVPALIERDNNIPPLAELMREAARADQMLAAEARTAPGALRAAS